MSERLPSTFAYLVSASLYHGTVRMSSQMATAARQIVKRKKENKEEENKSNNKPCETAARGSNQRKPTGRSLLLPHMAPPYTGWEGTCLLNRWHTFEFHVVVTHSRIVRAWSAFQAPSGKYSQT